MLPHNYILRYYLKFNVPTETGYELELLEEMVKHLQDPKSFLTAFPTPQRSSTMKTRSSKERPLVSSTPLPPTFAFQPDKNSTENDLSVPNSSKNHVQPTDTTRTCVAASSSEGSNHDRASHTSSDKTSFSSKKSALSALKSLQKDHDERCSFLAEHIQKLKEENAAKEMRLRQLEQSTS